MIRKVIPDLDVILKGSKYEAKLENFKRFFKQSNIVTINDLENSPRYIGSKLCGFSTYEFIGFVCDCTMNPPQEPPEEPKPEPKTLPKKKRATQKKAKPIVVTDDKGESPVESDIVEDTHIVKEKE